jgi:hypothetical protein
LTKCIHGHFAKFSGDKRDAVTVGLLFDERINIGDGGFSLQLFKGFFGGTGLIGNGLNAFGEIVGFDAKFLAESGK